MDTDGHLVYFATLYITYKHHVLSLLLSGGYLKYQLFMPSFTTHIWKSISREMYAGMLGVSKEWLKMPIHLVSIKDGTTAHLKLYITIRQRCTVFSYFICAILLDIMQMTEKLRHFFFNLVLVLFTVSTWGCSYEVRASRPG